jgi:hypothetical protein
LRSSVSFHKTTCHSASRALTLRNARATPCSNPRDAAHTRLQHADHAMQRMHRSPPHKASKRGQLRAQICRLLTACSHVAAALKQEARIQDPRAPEQLAPTAKNHASLSCGPCVTRGPQPQPRPPHCIASNTQGAANASPLPPTRRLPACRRLHTFRRRGRVSMYFPGCGRRHRTARPGLPCTSQAARCCRGAPQACSASGALAGRHQGEASDGAAAAASTTRRHVDCLHAPNALCQGCPDAPTAPAALTDSHSEAPPRVAPEGAQRGLERVELAQLTAAVRAQPVAAAADGQHRRLVEAHAAHAVVRAAHVRRGLRGGRRSRRRIHSCRPLLPARHCHEVASRGRPCPRSNAKAIPCTPPPPPPHRASNLR